MGPSDVYAGSSYREFDYSRVASVVSSSIYERVFSGDPLPFSGSIVSLALEGSVGSFGYSVFSSSTTTNGLSTYNLTIPIGRGGELPGPILLVS